MTAPAGSTKNGKQVTEAALFNSVQGKVEGTLGDSHEAMSYGKVEIVLINCRSIKIRVDIGNQRAQDSELGSKIYDC